MVTAEKLRAIFDYDVLTGEFVRKVYRSANAQQGQRIRGAVTKNGYRVIHVEGKVYLAHRLAWLHVHGAFPPKGIDIDHINGDRQDNRLSNLRLATRTLNNVNRQKTNAKSGVIGVTEDNGKWLLRMYDNGIRTHHMRFDTLEQAAAMREQVKAERFAAGRVR